MEKSPDTKVSLSFVNVNVKGAALVCFSFRMTVSGLPNALELGRNSMKIINFLHFYFISLRNYTKATVRGLVQLLIVVWKGKPDQQLR